MCLLAGPHWCTKKDWVRKGCGNEQVDLSRLGLSARTGAAIACLFLLPAGARAGAGPRALGPNPGSLLGSLFGSLIGSLLDSFTGSLLGSGAHRSDQEPMGAIRSR